MYQTDLVQTWLDSVALSHSGAQATEKLYRYHFECFLKYIEATPETIQKDYDELPERQFRQKYGQAIRSWSSQLLRKDYAQGTVAAFLIAVKSFFRHNDFPLSFVPSVRRRVVFHNRDISKEEILQVIGMSSARERAFYAIMAQSGLRPSTLCQLKIKHLQPDFSQGKNPMMITVPEDLTKGKYHGYFTFIGEDAIRLLRAYLDTRRNLSPESLLFVNQGTEDQMIFNTFSSMFRKAVRLLRDKGQMTYEQKKKDRPAEIRLYNLRKFFRKQAIQAGFENVEFWMGHTGPGVDQAYRPKDPEFYRKAYAEKAMPFLRLESFTPTETEKQIEELRGENAVLKEKLQQTSQSFEERLANMERALAINEAEGFKQVLQAINGRGKDKLQVPYEFDNKPGPEYYTPEAIEKRRREREEILKKAKDAKTESGPGEG